MLDKSDAIAAWNLRPNRFVVESQNFRSETFAESRQQLVNVLKAQKSWMTGYAEAYVDEFADMARLAALAGAAPVAWLYEYAHDGEHDHCLSCTRFLPSWVEAKGAKETPLFTHAPAKAREDGVLRALPGKWRGITTNRDIEWSARKFMEGYDAALVNCANDLDAALATFAEGADDVSISAQNRP